MEDLIFLGELHLFYLTNQIHLKFKCEICSIFFASNLTTKMKIVLLLSNPFHFQISSTLHIRLIWRGKNV